MTGSSDTQRPPGRVIGVDLGGTKILTGVVDDAGSVHDTVEHPTPVGSQNDLLDALERVVSESLRPGIDAVGFGIPARIDQKTGLALGAVNIPLHNVPFVAEMERRLGVRVAVANDASAAALGEFRFGAGRGSTDMVMLTLGTGVGGGVVIAGRLYPGWSELGHMVIVEDGEPCQGTCSGHGHVEAYCSGLAAERLARAALGPSATAHDLVEQRHPALEEIGRHLGVAIAGLVNIFGPDIVVVGGGFGIGAGELLLEPARRVLATEALRPGGSIPVVRAELGERAGLVGAGLLALEALGSA
ncbi:MAG: ROK family protein [Actinobacteria bacterium]|uniref:Unannotated protein n=1 Tax=freshwater metagenome TaxID=449393 RepID=A0A6J6PP93_9ZZZZ|nr:ROK family protein [Actinomycetota bacterium]